MKPTRARPCPPQHAGHRILFGLAVVGIGVLALLDNLHFFDISLMRTFWPLGLVLWGLGRLAGRGRRAAAWLASSPSAQAWC
ncbi:LiaI-LiaF-like domain-containing protein [Roseateles sp.]|uniref:LiaI-LiaF-like domain-containing protein n=1 Tax=Roseateles sp. TaxID=1971397 RepID=UPI003266674C